jgi:hypothetical protein
MTATTSIHRPSRAARRAGYVIAAMINAVLIYLVNDRPGWQAVPVLTDSTREVLGIFTVSLVAGIVVNLVYLAYDPPRIKALGDLITTGIGLAVMVRVWRVFPFDFGASSFDWTLVARIALVVAMAGAAVGVLVQLVTLVRGRGRLPADR